MTRQTGTMPHPLRFPLPCRTRYEEVCDIDWSRPLSITHFAMVVWKSTRELGCGFSVCPRGVSGLTSSPTNILVCRYNPPGA